MGERLREKYFILLRVVMVLILEMYIVISQSVLTGASVKVLLLLALFIGVVSGKELAEGKLSLFFLITPISKVVFSSCS